MNARLSGGGAGDHVKNGLDMRADGGVLG